MVYSIITHGAESCSTVRRIKPTRVVIFRGQRLLLWVPYIQGYILRGGSNPPIFLRMLWTTCTALCTTFLCPRPGGIKRWCCLTSCLSDVCRVHPVGGRRVRPAGWMARIGWSGPARPTWLKAAHAGFRCRPGRGISCRPPAYSLYFVYRYICK